MAFLRRSAHPDFSDLLVHFTGRSGNYAELPGVVATLSAVERLESILQNRTIWPSRPFSPAPVVCFSEATNAGLNHVIGDLGYQPWGIVFSRNLVYEWGGGPVFHYRPDEWQGHREPLPPSLRARFIRFEAGESEWLWEREWRIVFEDDAPGFKFDPEQVEAVIVGDSAWPEWEPDPAYAALMDDEIAQQTLGPPDWLPDCPLWWWNPRRGVLEVRS